MTTVSEGDWIIIAGFLWGPSVGRVICAGNWWARNIPEHVWHLSLLPQYLRFYPRQAGDYRDYEYDDFRMLVEDHTLLLRAYLRRFRRVRILEVSLLDEPSASDDGAIARIAARHRLYYVTVTGALGSILESGYLPLLSTLTIIFGAHHIGVNFLQMVHPYNDDFYTNTLEDVLRDPTKPFVFYPWMHQLALSIVRAVHGNGAPRLRHICLKDTFGFLYFGPNRMLWRQSDEPVIRDIRTSLSDIAEMRP
jgi:hypothetical protein